MKTNRMKELAIEVLKSTQNNTAMTSQEIWKKAQELGLDTSFYLGKTPAHLNLYNTLNQDINTNDQTEFKKVSKNPILFALKNTEISKTDIDNKLKQIEESEVKDANDNVDYNEADLHPVLAMYVNNDSHFNCFVKTIPQQTAKKPRAKDRERISDQWTYPDLIGVYFPFKDYDEITSKICGIVSIPTIKVYSFEMKKEITPSVLRNYYFQAVSNSSWANEGYLVAPFISDDAEFMKELTLLNNSFGIGVIRLDIQNPMDSQIIIPSRCREQLDVAMLDKLVSRSPEVREFFATIDDSMHVKYNTKVNFFDKILSEEEYHSNKLNGLGGRKK